MASGDKSRTPFVEYFDDKRDPDNYVRVNVDIKGLKKKFASSVAANAEIEFHVEERSFCLSVKLTNGSKDHYVYKIKELPEAISTDPKKTMWKVKKDGEVSIKLHKVRAGLWARYLSDKGLEHATEQDEPN